jgi:hypothetical protein
MTESNNSQPQISLTSSSYFSTKKFIIIIFLILGLSNLFFLNLFYEQKKFFGELRLHDENENPLTTNITNISITILSNDDVSIHVFSIDLFFLLKKYIYIYLN